MPDVKWYSASTASGISVASGSGTTNVLMKFDASDNAADSSWTDASNLLTSTAATGLGLGTATPKTIVGTDRSADYAASAIHASTAQANSWGALAASGPGGGHLFLYSTTAAANQRLLALETSSSTFYLLRYNDAMNAFSVYLSANMSTDVVTLGSASVAGVNYISGTGNHTFSDGSVLVQNGSSTEVGIGNAANNGFYFGSGAMVLTIGGTDVWYANSATNIQRASGVKEAWTSAGVGSTADLRLGRAAVGGLSIDDNADGKALGVKMLTELTTIAAAATTDTTIQIPANSLVIAVTTRVTTVIPTAATYDIGVAGATTRYGSGISTAATTTSTSPGTTSPTIYGSAVSLRITPNLTPGDTTGRVRVTIYYIDATPPTS